MLKVYLVYEKLATTRTGYHREQKAWSWIPISMYSTVVTESKARWTLPSKAGCPSAFRTSSHSPAQSALAGAFINFMLGELSTFVQMHHSPWACSTSYKTMLRRGAMHCISLSETSPPPNTSRNHTSDVSELAREFSADVTIRSGQPSIFPIHSQLNSITSMY